MKIFGFLMVAAVAICIILASFLERVDAGYVGVKVNMLGGSKGVDTEVVGVGRHFIGLNQKLYRFPTYMQNYVWTRSAVEGSPNNESISFQTQEGLTVEADIGISYAVNPEKVATIFQKYRKGIDEITDIYLRNMVRDAIVTESSIRPITDVYGKGKADLIQKVETRIREQVTDIGLNVEKIYWVGELRLPQSVISALNDKITATQKAQQRENEVAEAEAEAKKKIAQAHGEAESKLALAKAEAEAIRIKGDALRDNPALVELEAVNRWNGVLPVYAGVNGVPFINLGEKPINK